MIRVFGHRSRTIAKAAMTESPDSDAAGRKKAPHETCVLGAAGVLPVPADETRALRVPEFPFQPWPGIHPDLMGAERQHGHIADAVTIDILFAYSLNLGHVQHPSFFPEWWYGCHDSG